MLARDMTARPTMPYNGQMFRSKLETHFAQYFDKIGLGWRYEPQQDLVPYYLPDFQVWDMPGLDPRIGAHLPGWVEVKPMGMIYELRDLLGLPEVFPEEETRSSQVTAAELQQMQVEEFWKPKQLAEASRIAVLVAGQVNGTRTLSALMLPDDILWQRNHPLVNWRGVQEKQRRAEERARWEAENQERQRQWQAERDEQAARDRAGFLAIVRGCPEQPAKYPGQCLMCRRYLEADSLTLFRQDTGYRLLCASCIASLGS